LLNKDAGESDHNLVGLPPWKQPIQLVEAADEAEVLEELRDRDP
jgi:hypothetical protein